MKQIDSEMFVFNKGDEDWDGKFLFACRYINSHPVENRKIRIHTPHGMKRKFGLVDYVVDFVVSFR